MDIQNKFVGMDDQNYNNFNFGQFAKGILTGGVANIANKDKDKGKKTAKQSDVDLKAKKAEFKNKYGKGWRKQYNNWLKSLGIGTAEVQANIEPETEDTSAGLGSDLAPDPTTTDAPFYKKTWFVVTAIAVPVLIIGGIVFYKMRK